MSFHYEVVFSLFLRNDTPDEVLAELRWHLGLSAQRPPMWALGYEMPVLRPGDCGDLAGGESAALSRQRRSSAGSAGPAWGLHARLFWLDERWAELWWQVATWLSRYADEDGYAGFYRGESDEQPTLLLVRGGLPYLCEFGGQPRAFSS